MSPATTYHGRGPQGSSEAEDGETVVIDEWGSFEEVLTVEDILEEIVGEIRDEFDEE